MKGSRRQASNALALAVILAAGCGVPAPSSGSSPSPTFDPASVFGPRAPGAHVIIVDAYQLELGAGETRAVLVRVLTEGPGAKTIAGAEVKWELRPDDGTTAFGGVTSATREARGTVITFEAARSTNVSGTLIARHADLSVGVWIRVRSFTPKTLRVDPAAVQVRPGALEPLAAVLMDSDGRLLCAPAAWRVEPASAGTVDPDGLFKAARDGPSEARVVASVTGPSGPVTASALVTIRADAPPPPSPTVPRAGSASQGGHLAALPRTTLPPPRPSGTFGPDALFRPDVERLDMAIGMQVPFSVSRTIGGQPWERVSVRWTVCPTSIAEFRLDVLAAKLRGGGALEGSYRWGGQNVHRVVVFRVR